MRSNVIKLDKYCFKVILFSSLWYVVGYTCERKRFFYFTWIFGKVFTCRVTRENRPVVIFLEQDYLNLKFCLWNCFRLSFMTTIVLHLKFAWRSMWLWGRWSGSLTEITTKFSLKILKERSLFCSNCKNLSCAVLKTVTSHNMMEESKDTRTSQCRHRTFSNFQT